MTGNMKGQVEWLLGLIYGPEGASDPYYQFFLEAGSLIPLWYPTLILSCMMLFMLHRMHGRLRYRRRSARAAARIMARTRGRGQG